MDRAISLQFTNRINAPFEYKGVFASDYYQRDFLKYNERLGADGLEFKRFVPRLYLPVLLQSLGYRTHAMVSLPVLNPLTILNSGFDTYKLMERHNGCGR